MLSHLYSVAASLYVFARKIGYISKTFFKMCYSRLFLMMISCYFSNEYNKTAMNCSSVVFPFPVVICRVLKLRCSSFQFLNYYLLLQRISDCSDHLIASAQV